ncbi:transport and golgi organization 14 [Brevipalpus obovatus]|uniref:transport and golgi organization 14 n=1 Tax=Brevipalpus obovatus TaxID=246614 RepID=UPI003D9E2510
MSAVMRLKDELVDYSFKFMLNCVHMVFTVCLLLSEIWSYVRRRWTISRNIIQFSQSVKKIPKHIVFIIDGNEKDKYVSLEEICQLMQWSITLEISNISLYDNRGYFVKNMDLLESLLSRALCLSPDDQIKFKPSQKNGSNQHNVIYHTNFKSSTLRILSMLNGKQTITMIAKELITKISKSIDESEKIKTITSNDIDFLMMEKISVPEPDLAIICSTKPCLFGLLPWHMRLTEMIKLPKLGPLMPQDFVYVMNRFSLCHQRYGR